VAFVTKLLRTKGNANPQDDHTPSNKMNEAATENLAKLQLDPETGEMVYKSELK
jgi:hypothetical protein